MDDMRITVIADDRRVSVNGESYLVEAEFDPDIHVIQWNPFDGKTFGHIERKHGDSCGFNDFLLVHPFYEAWRRAKAAAEGQLYVHQEPPAPLPSPEPPAAPPEPEAPLYRDIPPPPRPAEPEPVAEAPRPPSSTAGDWRQAIGAIDDEEPLSEPEEEHEPVAEERDYSITPAASPVQQSAAEPALPVVVETEPPAEPVVVIDESIKQQVRYEVALRAINGNLKAQTLLKDEAARRGMTVQGLADLIVKERADQEAAVMREYAKSVS